MPDEVSNPHVDPLESAITRWRDQLDGLTRVERAELEDHLRKTLATLPDEGLSFPEKVLIAANRIGPSRDIAHQFEDSLVAPRR